MNKHKIHIIGAEDNEALLLIEEELPEACRLICEYREKSISAEADDYFEAFCKIRERLENEGIIPFCYGTSLDVYPSRMSRQMSKGKAAYRLEMGKSARRENIVKIFDKGPDVIPSKVQAQREYYEEWLCSLTGLPG
ncbi:MAG: hypothetical protein A2X85_05835 [Geobacteraceae bacterium GWF2_54_21]|nr:MAG: hypothetical protein A2X85_05835 [Geobacteraceae bacterium GWF2_54_21]